MKPSLARPLAASAALALALASALPLRAQHAHGGGGPEMKPLPVAERPAAVSFGEGVQEDAALLAFFRDLAEALRTHDGKPFGPRLADNFTIPGYDTPDTKAGFVLAMTMIPGPEAIVITGIEPQEGGGKLIKTGFKFPKRTAKREFTLNADGKLVMTTLVAMKRVERTGTPSH